MRTKGRGAPDAGEPWNEIVPGLWMGGHRYRDVAGVLRDAVVAEEFDVVCSLYLRDGHGPPPHVEHHCALVPDDPLSSAEIRAVLGLAEIAAEAVRGGRRVLVRCHSGYNRSGLVVAQALVLLGHEMDDAIFLIRRRRSRWALNNRLFEEYLTTGLDVACLLTGLDA
ncbi:protein-tyrosine phosphatase family protein [Actinomadura macrotermitis]|uniref:protein-tyrosine phosphatase family protein n=1 Tax=Actinomadura macrotermitis TaxID=2585200 RepID=UPI001A9A84D1|nr:dual specificity protein phosphatase family protein [Actinomadura macrotermitis]